MIGTPVSPLASLQNYLERFGHGFAVEVSIVNKDCPQYAGMVYHYSEEGGKELLAAVTSYSLDSVFLTLECALFSKEEQLNSLNTKQESN